MPTFRSTRQVKHSAAEMFALVADVERYPEFVPLCESLRVVRRAQSGEGIETIVAAMSVGYKAIRESFTSRVELDHPRLADRRRICGRAVQVSREPLDLPRHTGTAAKSGFTSITNSRASHSAS